MSFVAGLVALILLFGCGGGLAAYLLVLKKHDTPATEVAVPPTASDDAEASPPSGGVNAGGGDSSTSSGSQAPNTGASGDGDSDTASDSGSGDSGDNDSTDQNSAAGSSARPGSPEAVLRQHFEDIDNGDYEAAWRLLYPDYRNTTGVNWVSQRKKEQAKIDVISITRDGSAGRDVVRLDAEIVAADSIGEGAGVCRLFSGWTRMQKSGGRWLYRPGEVDGVKPGFSSNARELDSSDSRCSRVLG